MMEQEVLSEGFTKPLNSLTKAASVDESRLYRKHGGPSGNGSLRGLGKKIQRQTSVNYPSTRRSSSASFSGPRGVQSVSAPIVDTEKLLAAKKRRQESVSGNPISLVHKKTWSEKVNLFMTICISTLLILTTASLLFISLLVVDPIVVGLRAHFRDLPGICRTSDYRKAMGPNNCVMPACREGCTADLYVCTYIYVSYFEVKHQLNLSLVQSYYNHEIEDPEDSILPILQQEYNNYTNNIKNIYCNNTHSKCVRASLMINSHGCGYPPEVNCSNFYDRFLQIGSLFPCFYSDTFLNENLGVAVPFYDRDDEIVNLGIYFGIPLVTIVVLGLLLIFLSRCNNKMRSKQQRETTIPESPPMNFSRNKVSDSIPKCLNGKSFSSPSPKGGGGGDLEERYELEDEIDISGGDKYNGHGPKKKTPQTFDLDLQKSIEKTEKSSRVILTTEQVQLPSTSKF